MVDIKNTVANMLQNDFMSHKERQYLMDLFSDLQDQLNAEPEPITDVDGDVVLDYFLDALLDRWEARYGGDDGTPPGK